MVNGTLPNIGKRYEDNLRVIFDQWPKLNLGFDVEPEIQILKIIYCTKGDHYYILRRSVQNLGIMVQFVQELLFGFSHLKKRKH